MISALSSLRSPTKGNKRV
ncbi:hypothetical protein F383_11838 [Gossypium arboreum]|uniref:Uncharacterized protein n=1 Tax=Gossypium arboreum TaxID=29729 RepID=A0A0B0MFV7_GOSAR|nr:hypothetical protein F383_38574 [Gossypium arboreum]KHG25574.1 hypothetical protein F383_31956 [Gossypium arboreum]KHG30289.1 hypothetical protein F383_11838 [Gossypium arboreum]